MSDTCRVKVTIVNRLGLHARPAMSFVDLAGTFASQIAVCRTEPGSHPVDGKSIMQMMMLAATKGTQLEIAATGPDAEQACAALKRLVESGFEEE